MKKITFFLLLLLNSFAFFSQVNSSSRLFDILRVKDSLLFNVGYNDCDITQFENLISDNFEFYHDKSGFIASKTKFIRSIREGPCQLPYKPKIELNRSSLAVYHLENEGVLYGAIQTGAHRFDAVEEGKPPYLTSTADFTHVWLLQNGNWKLSRGLSYNHKENQIVDNDTIKTSLLLKDKVETERWLRKNQVTALGIGYIKDGKINDVKVYGELESGKPAPENTIWNVASLTKPITAMVTLKLIDAGNWSLDEPVYPYWVDPDVADDPRNKKLTTRHILSHQTGFPNWRYTNANGKLSFEFDPGTKFQYSGEGFEYLRRALENKFHTTLEQLADSLIFTPLQMNDTKYYWGKTIDETRFAKWHDENGKVYKTYKNKSANAADDLLTTLNDYCHFMIHVMEGVGISQELYSEMISDQVKVKSNQHCGLGWLVDENIDEGGYAITHGGDDKGMHTIVFMLPESKQGLLIFTNADNGVSTYIETILFYLGDLGQGIIDVETK
jgi:CubicO group peptidase (beta-lactamase class C family)